MIEHNFNIGPNSLPKYVQISEFLAREIASGRFVSGERLPPERQMAKNFKTSVMTLRKALSRLDDLGLLKRVHGSGNMAKQCGRKRLRMFKLELIGGGGLPRADILAVNLMKSPKI